MEKEALKDITFQPVVSESSKKLIETIDWEGDSRESLHDRLYQAAVQRQQTQEQWRAAVSEHQLKRDCTFTPEINNETKAIMRRSGRKVVEDSPSAENNGANFHNQYSHLQQQQQQRLQREAEPDSDDEFDINSSSSPSSSSNNANVFPYLLLPFLICPCIVVMKKMSLLNCYEVVRHK